MSVSGGSSSSRPRSGSTSGASASPPAGPAAPAVVAIPGGPVNEGDWICPEPECANLNFARRTSCNRCGKDKPVDSSKKKCVGVEIGKAAAEKSRGLFSADDWQCSKCGNVNWARRSSCNVCNAPKFKEVEERTGYGGGYNDRGVVEYIEREESDDEFDEFGRRKKKFRKLKPGESQSETEESNKDDANKPANLPIADDDEEEDEEEDDDDDDDDEDGDLSKYDLSDWGTVKDEENNKEKTEEPVSDKKAPRGRSLSKSSESSNRSSKDDQRRTLRDKRSRSRSKDKRNRSRSRDRKSRSRSRERRHRSRSPRERKARSRSRDRKHRSKSREKRSRSRSRDRKRR